MGRRKIESPDEFRPTDAINSNNSVGSGGGQQLPPIERKSVFERLGNFNARRGAGGGQQTMDESDLRYRMSRKRRTNDKQSSPPTAQTPLSPPPPSHRHVSGGGSGGKGSSIKSEDKSDAKVKSLVLAPNRRSESPPMGGHSVSSSTSKRPTHRSGKYDGEDVDSDSEDLGKKKLEILKQLMDLESAGAPNETTAADVSTHKPSAVSPSPVVSVAVPQRDLSRSSSLISSESDSYSSSLTKTESSESIDIKTVKSSANKAVDKKSDKSDYKSKLSDSKARTPHVSSSISVKSGTHLGDSSSRSASKGSEVKLDRHGNVRISLDEQERQKRLRAERFGHNKSKNESKKKKSSRDTSRHSTEPKIVVSREDSYSPPSKKSKESSERLVTEALKPERTDDSKKDRNSGASLHSTKYDSLSPRSRSHERKDNSKHEDNRSKSSTNSSKQFLDTNSGGLRDRSRESHYSERDNASVGRKYGRQRGGHHSREQSPTHSSHSKLSRDRESSIGSDFSRRSKSERLSTKSIDHNKSNNELKTIEIKVNDSIIEDRLSSISADSSIPDVPEMDSPLIASKEAKESKRTKSLSPKRVETKVVDDSDSDTEDKFSDWSDTEDEILLKKDGFETLDEVCNISDNSLGKDSWTAKSSHSKSKRDSHSSHSIAHNKDDALEAISDDELDAIIGDSDPSDTTVDAKTSNSSRQVLDSLDIDWGSLVTEPKAKLEFIPGSARKRFSAANVLMRIGFSQAFAGQQMTQKLIDFCQNELKEEFVPFRHPIAAVHSIMSDRIRERLQLFGADTTPATVLSGRKDLQIRKMLNKSNFKLTDNCVTTGVTAATPPSTTTTIATITTTTPPVNELSVSSTNPIGSHVSDIECF
ncbi:unnamed protein product [Medioppia subpectinata]|uniref:Uncharacterized protein n=1 Tax=Medioppia subpectinata TaxID=1979941 RepID=A0A7R9KHD5_9ACAR|nr:unnamed protein product [Medioppia subpectinata]CAG2103368.1 unnamed protein product [Medioppia subpectinata]